MQAALDLLCGFWEAASFLKVYMELGDGRKSWPVDAQVGFMQRRIAKVWRLFWARKQRNRGKILVRVELPAIQPGRIPAVLGSFTAVPWEQRLLMAYSLRYRVYFLEIWMAVTDLFQVVRGADYVFPEIFQKSLYHTVSGHPCLLPIRSDEHYRCMLRFHARKTRTTPLLSFAAAASLIPRQGKLLEDAHFLEGNLLGVADGVGGWRGLGIDSGKFAAELIQACQRQSLDSWSLVHTPLDSCEEDTGTPYSCLLPIAERALSTVEACGSCTLLLCAIHSGLLEILNLGDSRALLVRFSGNRPSVVARTSPMQHTFNTPFQVSRSLSRPQLESLMQSCPPEQAKALFKTLSHIINDGFDQAHIYMVRVQAGDLLLVGSDGLWDNLYEWEVLELLSPGASCEQLARMLTRRAYERSVRAAKTPFEDEAVATFGQCAWKGGKQDDITVIAAWIREIAL